MNLRAYLFAFFVLFACTGYGQWTGPDSKTACTGETITFQAVFGPASGTVPTISWEDGANNFPSGATSITGVTYTVATTNIPLGPTFLIISTLQIQGSTMALNGANYNATTGTLASPSATLTLNAAPSISIQPSDASNCAGEDITLSVTATNATSYQWQKNGVNIGSAINNSYTIVSSTNADEGAYRVIAAAIGCPNATSSEADVIIIDDVEISNATADFNILPNGFFILTKTVKNSSSNTDFTFSITGASSNPTISGFGSTSGSFDLGTPINTIGYTLTTADLGAGISIASLSLTNDDQNNVLAATTFTVTGPCGNDVEEIAINLLPVELTFFKGEIFGDLIYLKWQTASELNNVGFFVERSQDGLRWKEMDFIKGFGTTLETHDYKWADTTPDSGNNYYRLKQVDRDGTTNYSEIVVVNFDKSKLETFVVAPNPTQGYVAFNYQFSIQAVQVLDQLGKVVKNIQQPTNGIDLTELPKGIYTIIATTAEQVVAQQVVKE
jgi:hypothetical protein